MTTAISITDTTDTADGTVAPSPALGPDPAAPAGAGDVAATADPDAPTVEAAGPPPATVSVYKDGDGRLHYASPFSKAVRDRVAAGTWSEVDPADVEASFDPTEHLVREVVAHLEEHAGNEAEVQRVKDAEAAGADRATIRDWSPADE